MRRAPAWQPLATSKATEFELAVGPQRADDQAPAARARRRVAVSSYYQPDNATATLIVNEKTGTVLPHGVVYRKPGAAKKDWAFFARRVPFGVAGAALAYVIATRLAGVSVLMSMPIALAAGLVAAVVSIRFEKIPGT